MPRPVRIPLTAITVFATSGLLAVSVAIVLYLGFSQAAQSTRLFWASQAETLIDSMEASLDARFTPVRDQALWVAQDLRGLQDPATLDEYMFGVLAATPQVAGVAVIRPDGTTRRWHRAERHAISENWSDRDWFEAYLRQVGATDGPTWREPIFTDTVGTTTLLHDVALRDAAGEFIGVFAQIVPVHEFSEFLSRLHASDGITPFVLYDRERVLAHPEHDSELYRQTLADLETFRDPVMRRIWSPDEAVPYIARLLHSTSAAGLHHQGSFYLFLYRDIERYGPAPWTLGAYIDTTKILNDPGRRLMRAAGAGLIVLLIGVLLSVLVGRSISKPVQSLARAAEAIEHGDLDAVGPFASSRVRELDDAQQAFAHMVSGLRERRLIRDTLGRFLPEEVASSLLAGGGELEVQQAEATILFCDIEAFTELTESVGPVRIVAVLNAYFSAMVDILERRGGVVTQFQGDAILATFNVPIADPGHAVNAVLSAQEMLACVRDEVFADVRLAIRIGINTGTVVAGAIGARGRLNYTVHGDAVNLAARLEALNKEYGTRLLLTEQTAARVPDREFVAIGTTRVRGQSGSIRLYTLAPADQPD